MIYDVQMADGSAKRVPGHNTAEAVARAGCGVVDARVSDEQPPAITGTVNVTLDPLKMLQLFNRAPKE